MPVDRFKKDTLIVMALIILCLTVTISGLYTSNWVSRSMLEKHARDGAGVWYRHLASMPEDLNDLISSNGASDRLRQATASLKHFTHIVRYEIFGPGGHLAYSSGQIKETTVPPLEAAYMVGQDSINIDRMNPVVRLFASNNPHKPKRYAAVLMPIRTDQVAGSVLVYVDQTEELEKLSEAFNIIAAITALILFAAMAVPVIVVAMKIRDRRKAEEHIHFLAHNDPLTGLANRVTFNEKLTEALLRHQRTKEIIGVLFLDLDKFKDVNDTHGHAAGDALLKQFAARLQECVRETDLVARLSGDEFAIALINVASVQHIQRTVERIFTTMSTPIDLGCHTIRCSASVGIAVAPEDGTDVRAIMKSADLALYRSKGEGRNQWNFFEHEMDEAVRRQRKLEGELRLAIEREEFELHFQPQFDLRSGLHIGGEALVRWRHPEKGLITPGEFIQVAEETGLIVPISEWVMREACKEAAGWRNPLTVAVNLSPKQFTRSSVAELIEDALFESGLSASRLEIEITETSLLSDTEKVITELAILRQRGISIAMDDFGTGFSSLGYLSRFQFDKIKIDRSFIRDLDSDITVRAIAGTIISLGQVLDIDIVAEGVETTVQVDHLRRLGCGQVQGFLYGRPQAAHHYAELVDWKGNQPPAKVVWSRGNRVLMPR